MRVRGRKEGVFVWALARPIRALRAFVRTHARLNAPYALCVGAHARARTRARACGRSICACSAYALARTQSFAPTCARAQASLPSPYAP
eukprot:6196539-Pleurochrysis_carterae.AAC.1